MAAKKPLVPVEELSKSLIALPAGESEGTQRWSLVDRSEYPALGEALAAIRDGLRYAEPGSKEKKLRDEVENQLFKVTKGYKVRQAHIDAIGRELELMEAASEETGDEPKGAYDNPYNEEEFEGLDVGYGRRRTAGQTIAHKLMGGYRRDRSVELLKGAGLHKLAKQVRNRMRS